MFVLFTGAAFSPARSRVSPLVPPAGVRAPYVGASNLDSRLPHERDGQGAGVCQINGGSGLGDG